MGENSKIEWCDATFNPWIGCTKVSAACDHCYAEPMATNRLGVAWGPGAPRRRTAASTWKQPLAWNRKAAKEGRRMRVFCASLADVFDAEVPDDWRDDLFALIAATPHLDWLLLTKRTKVMRDYVAALPKRRDTMDCHAGLDWCDWPLPNVWLGTTVENQAMANLRVPLLLDTPAVRRFLSMEPLLGPVDLTGLALPSSWPRCGCKHHAPTLNALTSTIYCPGCCEGPEAMTLPRLDWVITGGESGPGARPSHPDWFRSIRDQCEAAGVVFFMKQWGEFVGGTGSRKMFINLENGGQMAGDRHTHEWGDAVISQRVGKEAAGRLLDGVEHNGVPQIGTGEAA